jgi:hypothetical protein
MTKALAYTLILQWAYILLPTFLTNSMLLTSVNLTQLTKGVSGQASNLVLFLYQWLQHLQ